MGWIDNPENPENKYNKNKKGGWRDISRQEQDNNSDDNKNVIMTTKQLKVLLKQARQRRNDSSNNNGNITMTTGQLNVLLGQDGGCNDDNEGESLLSSNKRTKYFWK